MKPSVPLVPAATVDEREFRILKDDKKVAERVASAKTVDTQPVKKKVQSLMPVTEYAAWFKSVTGASKNAVQISVLLDTNSERNIISQRGAFAKKIWSVDKELDTKSHPFPGRGGNICEAKTKVRLTWRPEGSEKWMDTDFYIVDDDEPVAILGKEWADFQGIFHDVDFSVSPFRLPGIRSTRRT